jgi:hypothetical protein
MNKHKCTRTKTLQESCLNKGTTSRSYYFGLEHKLGREELNKQGLTMPVVCVLLFTGAMAKPGRLAHNYAGEQHTTKNL